MENIIRTKRKELGLSQEELAKRCGVSRQTVNAIENNKYDPTLTLAFSLAKELPCDGGRAVPACVNAFAFGDFDLFRWIKKKYNYKNNVILT